MGKITTIPLQMETKEKLKGVGYKGETYDEIVIMLLKMAEKYSFFERQKTILAKERFVRLEEI